MDNPGKQANQVAAKTNQGYRYDREPVDHEILGGKGNREHSCYREAENPTNEQDSDSGVDIDTGRANACKLLVRFLLDASQKFNIRLTELNGGSLRNAIPREADASFVVAHEHIEALQLELDEYLQRIQANFTAVEPNIEMLLISPEEFDQCWTFPCQLSILHALNACPNGVMRMSDDIEFGCLGGDPDNRPRDNRPPENRPQTITP